MDLHHCIKILAFSLLLCCFRLSWVNFSSAAITIPPSPPPSTSASIIAAAEALRSHGYSLYAAALVSTFSDTAQFSGTVLAAPDFIFSFSPSINSRALPRPSTTLLLYHSLKPPSLRWVDINTRPDGEELQTFHFDYCLFLFKNPNGEVSLASSKKPVLAINIRQPDLYVDENVAIHGVDGVLDPSTADKCSKVSMSDPAAQVQFWVHRSFLDRAIRVLRKRGFHVAASALAHRRPDLLALPAVTVFAPSDKVLFSNPDGFQYDIRRHIVPERLRFDRLTSFTEGTEFETLASNKTIFVESANDVVTVNGVRVDGDELYHNRWVVLYSIEPMTLDDAVGESSIIRRWDESSSETEDMIPGEMSNHSITSDLSLAVTTTVSKTTGESIETPSPAPGSNFLAQTETGIPGVSPASSKDYVEDMIDELIIPPSQPPWQSPAPVIAEATNAHCEVVSVVNSGVETSELFCPANALYSPENEQIQSVPDAAQFAPSDGTPESILKRLLQSEHSISDDENNKRDPSPSTLAADLFYYI